MPLELRRFASLPVNLSVYEKLFLGIKFNVDPSLITRECFILLMGRDLLLSGPPPIVELRTMTYLFGSAF